MGIALLCLAVQAVAIAYGLTRPGPTVGQVIRWQLQERRAR